jgi:hypothetical protein
MAPEQGQACRRQPTDHPGWLAGLPIAIKDYNDVEGQLTTYGAPMFAEHGALADDNRRAARERRHPVGQIERARVCRQPYVQSRVGHHAQPLGLERAPPAARPEVLRPRWPPTKSGSPLALASVARCVSASFFAAWSASGPAPTL